MRKPPPTFAPGDEEALVALLARFQIAGSVGDWPVAFGWLTWRAGASILAAVLFGCFYRVSEQRELAPSLFEILERHGLPKNTKNGIPEDINLGAAFQEIVDWMAASLTEEDASFGVRFARTIKDSQYVDFRPWSDDRAAATQRSEGRDRTMEFDRTADGWRISKL